MSAGDEAADERGMNSGDRLAFDREERTALAEAVRRACVEAAVQAAEDAGIRGLCADGQLQAAIDSMRSLRVEDFVGDS